MRLSLIVARSRNGVIGRDNQLPWHLPEDLKYFKRVTLGKPIIMGRKTWESIGRPLPGRANIVVSRQADYAAPGAQVVASLEAALDLARTTAATDGVDEVMIIGGEALYRLALPVADRLYMTEVDADIEGDAYFPEWNAAGWSEVSRELPSTPGDLEYAFVVYERAETAP